MLNSFKFVLIILLTSISFVSYSADSNLVDKAHFRLLAECEMRKLGTCVVPDVSYSPDFLTESEVPEFLDLFSRLSFAQIENGVATQFSCSSSDQPKLEKLFGLITDRLKEYKLLPADLKHLNYHIARYTPGSSLAQHKDGRGFVDH